MTSIATQATISCGKMLDLCFATVLPLPGGIGSSRLKPCPRAGRTYVKQTAKRPYPVNLRVPLGRLSWALHRPLLPNVLGADPVGPCRNSDVGSARDKPGQQATLCRSASPPHKGQSPQRSRSNGGATSSGDLWPAHIVGREGSKPNMFYQARSANKKARMSTSNGASFELMSTHARRQLGRCRPTMLPTRPTLCARSA